MIRYLQDLSLQDDNSIFMFGAGKLAVELTHTLLTVGVRIDGYFDNAYPDGGEQNGMSILPISVLSNSSRENTYIIVGSGHDWEIKKQLIEMGFSHIFFQNELAMRRNIEYSKLHFPKFNKPEVSILLTTANEHWDMAYNTLRSLQKNENQCQYEVIMGWDCPLDDGAAADKYLDGVKTICFKERHNYLGNLNAIACEAVGEYLLLLADDTLFTKKHYIDMLLSVIKQDENIGMTSGRLWVPYKRKYDTHYIYTSTTECEEVPLEKNTEVENMWPVAALVRSSLWKKLGGMDPIYLPVYYEDVDFEMKLLSNGYTMVATPDAECIHYGGGSYKMGEHDPNVIRNKQIFHSRWDSYIRKLLEKHSN